MVKSNYIKVFSPATIANVGCGFDIFGLALDNPGDEIELKIVKDKKIEIIEITGDDGILPLESNKNVATVALKALMEHINADFGVEVKLHKKMPFGSGLGSSAASSVAGVFALNEILENPLPKSELLQFTLEGEKIATGGHAHADNVAACLYGGFILVKNRNPLHIVNLPVKADLYFTVLHPQIEVRTEDSRKVLRQEISLDKAITQWSNVAGFVTGLLTGDYDLISKSIDDVIVEPVRSVFIPEFYEIKNAAISNGALGCSISGSGPSVFAVSPSLEISKKVGEEMVKVLDNVGVGSDIYYSKINNQGPIVLEKR